MSRGKRYDSEPKLNLKKVFAVIIAIAVIIMFIYMIIELLKEKPGASDKNFITAYYTIYENGKWGVIDTKGNTIIAPQYDEMIIIPDSSKKIFICMYNTNYETQTFNSKAVNDKNETLYTEYTKVEAISNYDENNTIWYENTLKVEQNGKYGLINLDGKNILQCEYDDITPIVGTKNALLTSKNGKKGVVDSIGKVIIENEYKSITALTEKYENGFIVENEQGKFGVINYNKAQVLEPKYEQIQHVYGNNMYVVKENGVQKIIDTEGNSYLEGKFEEVKEINLDNIIIKANGKYALVTKSGEQKIPAEYDDLTYAYTENYIAKKEGKYGIINSSNETQLNFEYNYLSYLAQTDFIRAETQNFETKLLDREFNEKVSGVITEINIEKGYIRVRENDKYKYYNLKLEEKESTDILVGNTIFLKKKDGKYGYINDKGIVVVDYIYDDATEQNKYGYVAVKKDGKWGCLDQNGKVILEPTYELSNNLVIDFIAQWYLAEDLNANYYTK